MAFVSLVHLISVPISTNAITRFKPGLAKRSWRKCPLLRYHLLWLTLIGRSLVVDHIYQNNSGNVDAIAYAYCSRDTNEPERAIPVELVRSLARQLAYDSSTSTIRQEVLDQYEELGGEDKPSRQLNLADCANLLVDL